MAKERESRYLKKLMKRVLHSDEVRNAALVQELSKCDRGKCSTVLLEDIIKQHLFHYQAEPDWQLIIDQLLNGFHFRAARVVTLYVPDDALRSQLIVTCLIRMRSQGFPIRPNPILN